MAPTNGKPYALDRRLQGIGHRVSGRIGTKGTLVLSRFQGRQ